MKVVYIFIKENILSIYFNYKFNYLCGETLVREDN